MKKSKIIKSIKNSKNYPVEQDWLKQGRQTLASYITDNPISQPEAGQSLAEKPVKKLSLIRQHIGEGKFTFKKLILKPMPIAIIALIISLATGSGVVAAAQDSLPTEVLYPIKLATERVQEMVTFNEAQKIELQTKLADKRLTEIQQLQNEDKATEEVVSETLKKYEEHLNIAQGHLSNIQQDYDVEEIASTVINLESTLIKQGEMLNDIEARASPEYQLTLTSAKETTLENANTVIEILEKIEIKSVVIDEEIRDKKVRIIPLYQKFEIQVREAITINKYNIKIYLETTSESTCSPCPEGKACTLNSCVAAMASIGISPPYRKNINKIYLAEGEEQNIRKNVYLKLLAINKGKATLIATQKNIVCPQIAILCETGQIPVQTGTNENGCPTWECQPMACPMPICNRAPYDTGKIDNNGCKIYKCPTEEKICVGKNETFNTTSGEECCDGLAPELICSDDGACVLSERICKPCAGEGENIYDMSSKGPISCCPDLVLQQCKGECTPSIPGVCMRQDIACSMPICGNGVKPYSTGEYNNGCEIYQCPKKSCEVVFSNCNCGYTCVETIPGQARDDCARACSIEETDNYKPNCGYRDNVCQDLNQGEPGEDIKKTTSEVGSAESQEGFFAPLLKIFNL